MDAQAELHTPPGCCRPMGSPALRVMQPPPPVQPGAQTPLHLPAPLLLPSLARTAGHILCCPRGLSRCSSHNGPRTCLHTPGRSHFLPRGSADTGPTTTKTQQFPRGAIAGSAHPVPWRSLARENPLGDHGPSPAGQGPSHSSRMSPQQGLEGMASSLRPGSREVPRTRPWGAWGRESAMVPGSEAGEAGLPQHSTAWLPWKPGPREGP